ncbi:hypothetical protein HQ487_04550 [Candidatus Uhrbacteria bacterium]|nr:hypothetical protein [Candidatus Uhrbacteria bacterium]
MSLVLGWLFMALPWLDLFLDGALGVGQYGSRKLIAMIAYGNELPNRTTDYYFLSVFLGILVLQFGVQLMRVGESFAKGQTFLNGRWSYPPL